MSDYKPFVILKLDKERKFRMSNKSFIYFEEISGKSLVGLDMSSIGIKELNQLIYAGLKSTDESITYTEVVDLIDDYGDMKHLSEKLQEAMESSRFLSQSPKAVVR